MIPNWSRADIPMMPKGRYKIMTNYMPKVGAYGVDMMYRTCTRAGEPRLFLRSRHGEKAARVAGLAARGDGAVRQFRPLPKANRTVYLSFRSQIWTATDKNAPACCLGLSTTAWDSSAMSITRSTFRCISSSAARQIYRRLGPSRSRISLVGIARRPAGRAADHFRLGQSLEHDLPRSGGSSVISRCAAPMAGRGGDCRRSPPIGVGILYDDEALNACWDMVKDMDGAGAPETARRRSAVGFRAEIRGRNVLYVGARDAAPGVARPGAAQAARSQRPTTRRVSAPARREHRAAASRRPRNCWSATSTIGTPSVEPIFGGVCVLSLLSSTGLVPVTPLSRALCVPNRDGRDKPGHDRLEIDGQIHTRDARIGKGRRRFSRYNEYDYDPHAERIGCRRRKPWGLSRRGF